MIEAPILDISPREIHDLLAQGRAFSGWMGERLLGCGGVYLLWPGVGEAWLRLSQQAVLYPVFVARSIVRMLVRIIEDLKVWRVQALVMKKHREGRHLVEWMGFQEEGEMVAYGPNGETYIRYALILPKYVPRGD